MEDIENRPTKRARTGRAKNDETQRVQINNSTKSNDVLKKQSVATSKQKSRSKKFGGNNSMIVDTMSKQIDLKKKAISISELKDIKQQHKNSENSKIIGSIIDLQSESDISMKNDSSPFRLIRSSQEFNIDTPEINKGDQNSYCGSTNVTPIMFKTKQSSDDGIFWVNTPPGLDKTLKENLKQVSNNQNGEFKLPSSPLKNDKHILPKDIHDTLLDPEIKNLMERYNENDHIVITEKPRYNRSISDPKALDDKIDNIRNSNKKTQIVASKTSLNDSVVDTLNKRQFQQNIGHNINYDDKIDLSNMLLMIGSKLSVNPNNEKKNISVPLVSLEALKSESIQPIQTEVNNNNNLIEERKNLELSDASDDFSDDIDMSEIAVYATQAATTKVEKSDDESDNCFSDDDGNLMERLELGLTQQQIQIRNGRPNTDQTDIDIMEVDTSEVRKNINLINISESLPKNVKMVKYKGMIGSKEDEDTKNNKPFKLFEENDNLAKYALKFDLMTRLQIKNVREGIFKRNSKVHKQIILQCLDENEKYINVIVRDHWASLEFKVNDVIHIIVNKVGDNFQLVDKDHSLLIWNPDTLLSATRVADAVDCKRRAIISHKFNGPGIISMPFIIGNITHALFQNCLLTKNVKPEYADSIIDELIDDHIIEIFAAGKNKGEIKNMILDHFVYIKEWITDYLEPGSISMNDNKTAFKAIKILDIEENIVSPIYGIRGIIDVVIEAKLKNNSTLVIPMEIKTGKEYISNRAQASLYTLLIKQRYDVDCFYTSLVYTKLHQCYLNALKSNDFKMLINIRNELSQYLAYAVTELPPILKRSSCERCFSVEPCMTLNKLTEDGTAEKSGIDEEKYEEITEHLNKRIYKEFYVHWDKLISKEEGLMGYMKTDIWRNTSDYRESNSGNCVGNLSIVNSNFLSVPKQYVYMFERDPSIYPPLTSSQLQKHDRIILSDQNSMFGLAHGYIKYLRSDIIVIVTDRDWSNSAIREADFNAENNQNFKSVLTTNDSSQSTSLQHSQQLSTYITSKTYRIDKDQMFHSMAMARFNLLNLFLPNGDERSRRLIVELDKPKFSVKSNFNYDAKKLILNEDQMRAVDVASKVEDYCLILGMPGTGKTTFIATIVDLIVQNGLTVLISSYTHSAVDNICEKLIQNSEKQSKKLSLLRVGALNKISDIVKPYSLYSENFENNMKNKSEFQDVISDSNIVAVTCMGINDVVFASGKTFDYCIIDEASQVTLPVVLGPIAFSEKFILVGDHYQLPPLVVNPEAKQEGLDQSVFKLLSDAHPQSVIELTHQYRMCSDIMSLSNELIYNGRLKCGSEKVANQKLIIPYLDSIPINDTCIKDILDPERRVVFVNEDAIQSLKEVNLGDKCDNPGEAKLITTMIRVMLMAGISQESIGVMSFYRAQLKHFYESLHSFKNIEVLTADRFQGRDKDIIIISLVRSETIGDLLKEWRRVNVAMTRAKVKLIIFGSKKLLESVEQFEGFIKMIESNGWFYDLKEGDEKVFGEINFLDYEVNGNIGKNNESASQVDTQTGKEIIGNFKGTKRLDHNSKMVRHSKILKYVIDDLIK